MASSSSVNKRRYTITNLQICTAASIECRPTEPSDGDRALLLRYRQIADRSLGLPVQVIHAFHL
jgi:hypothetical protein